MPVKPIPERLTSFWCLVERSLGPEACRRFYGASHFDDNERSANDLAALVLVGRKRATAGLVWSFDFDRTSPPVPGALSVITSWHGDPVCVIETRSACTTPFQGVDAEFAA